MKEAVCLTVDIQFDVGLPREHMILTARNQTAWRLFFEGEQKYYMTRWTDALRSYFQPSVSNHMVME